MVEGGAEARGLQVGELAAGQAQGRLVELQLPVVVERSAGRALEMQEAQGLPDVASGSVRRLPQTGAMRTMTPFFSIVSKPVT